MTAGFGLERIGLCSLRYPRAALAAVAAVTALLLVCASQLGFNSDVREIFRSDTPGYAAFEEMSRLYPGSESDVLLLAESDDLFADGRLERLRELHIEMQLAEGVRGVLSMFSARRPPDKDGFAAPLFPEGAGAAAENGRLASEALDHVLVSGKLLSEDRKLALMVISLEEGLHGLDEMRRIVAQIETAARGLLEGSGIGTGLAGIPVMRLEIIGALKRDQLVFRVAGIGLGLLLSWVFFRRLPYVAIAAAPVLVAMVWILGLLWLTGREINVLTNVVPTLVMVVAFSDSLHLLFAARRHIGTGLAPAEAAARAVREVGPACVLASLTTAIALLSLALVPHPFIARFGASAALGAVVAYLATIVVVPAMSALLLGPGSAAGPVPGSVAARAVAALSRGAAGLVQARACAIAGGGVLLIVVSGMLHALNAPHYLYSENLPAGNPASDAISRIDDKLAGASTMRLFMRWPPGHDMLSGETVEAVAEAQTALETVPLVREAWSLASLEQWLAGGDGGGREALVRYLREGRSPLVGRLILPESRSALVTGHYRDTDAAELNPVLDALEGRLAALAGRYPGLEISLTGISPLAARASQEMIAQLNRSLLVAVVVIIALIGVALRSAAAGVVSILPNLLPILVAGAALYLADSGLQFTSVIAFTIGFGIAVDSTIHVLNRYRLERDGGRPPADAVGETVTAIGPVLILTTVVLAAGFGVTMTSTMPMVKLYGRISVLLLATALAGDMLLLPALMRLGAGRLGLARRRQRPRGS